MWLLIIQYQQIQTAHFIVHTNTAIPTILHIRPTEQGNNRRFFVLLFFQSDGQYYVDSSSFLAFIAVNGKTYRISKIQRVLHSCDVCSSFRSFRIKRNGNEINNRELFNVMGISSLYVIASCASRFCATFGNTTISVSVSGAKGKN